MPVFGAITTRAKYPHILPFKRASLFPRRMTRRALGATTLTGAMGSGGSFAEAFERNRTTRQFSDLSPMLGY